MNRIVIADIRSMNTNGKSIGHYFSVAQNFIDIFKNSNRIFVAGGPVYEQRFMDWLIKLKYDSVSSVSIIRNKIHVLCNARQLFKECIDDIIIMQSSAVATAYIGVALFKRPGTKLYMVQYNIEGLNTLLKRFLYSLAIKKIDGIICPQKRVGEAYRKPYCVVSDYIYTGMKKKEDIPYERKRYDFCVIGLISKDKGVLEVAECLKGTNYHVLIAGLPQSDEIRQALQKICSEAENIDLKLYYLSEDDYKKSILVSRYCILNYSGAYSKHSSGVVFDIIFRGIPVIGRDCEAMSFIKEYGLGEIITDFNDFDPSSVLDKKKYETYQVNIQRYFELHRQYISDIKDFVSK